MRPCVAVLVLAAAPAGAAAQVPPKLKDTLPGGHSGRVTAVAFSPDGKVLASGSDDGTVRLWDPATARGVAVLSEGANRYVRGVAFSPDGKALAAVVVGDGGRVAVWEVGTGKKRHTLAAGTVGPPQADAPTLAVWDVAAGRKVHALGGHTGRVSGIAYSPDGKVIATAGGEGTARLWEAATGKPVATLEGHAGAVHAVAFSPDGRTLATGGADGTIRLWDLAPAPR